MNEKLKQLIKCFDIEITQLNKIDRELKEFYKNLQEKKGEV